LLQWNMQHARYRQNFHRTVCCQLLAASDLGSASQSESFHRALTWRPGNSGLCQCHVCTVLPIGTIRSAPVGQIGMHSSQEVQTCGITVCTCCGAPNSESVGQTW